MQPQGLRLGGSPAVGHPGAVAGHQHRRHRLAPLVHQARRHQLAVEAGAALHQHHPRTAAPEVVERGAQIHRVGAEGHHLGPALEGGAAFVPGGRGGEHERRLGGVGEHGGVGVEVEPARHEGQAGRGGLAPGPAPVGHLVGGAQGPVALDPRRRGAHQHHVGHRPQGPEHRLVPRAAEASGAAVHRGGAVHTRDHVHDHPGPALGRRSGLVVELAGIGIGAGGSGEELAHARKLEGPSRPLPTSCPWVPCGQLWRRWAAIHRQSTGNPPAIHNVVPLSLHRGSSLRCSPGTRCGADDGTVADVLTSRLAGRLLEREPTRHALPDVRAAAPPTAGPAPSPPATARSTGGSTKTLTGTVDSGGITLM